MSADTASGWPFWTEPLDRGEGIRWKKVGKVFDPTTVNLPVGCLEFAQSPHALKFEDFVRVFFSTRSADSDGGKYRSHIAFVDMDKSFQSVIRVSSNEVIPLGALGTFDEHGIFPMSLLRHGDAIYGYTTGWSRRVSVSVETAIGLAVSHDDGVSFQRAGPGPILAASLHEPSGFCCVLRKCRILDRARALFT